MDTTLVDQSQPVQTPENRLIPVSIAITGVILGVILSFLYTGRFLILYITQPGPSPLLEGDKPNPPRVGFNRLHNLVKFPDQIIRNPDAYELVHVQGGRMKSLPPEIGKLNNLVSFIVDDNKLGSIPEPIGNLSNLEELNFGGNKLSTLPSSIGNLSKLKKLYLYNNKITFLPASVGNLTSLETLDLHSNNLTTLPAEISNLANLKILYLGGNNIAKSEQLKIQSELPNTLIYF